MSSLTEPSNRATAPDQERCMIRFRRTVGSFSSSIRRVACSGTWERPKVAQMLVLLYLREESYRKMHVVVLEVSLKRCCTWTPQKFILCSVEYHRFCFVTTRRCTGKLCTPIEGSGVVVHLQRFRDHNWPIVGVTAVVAFVSAAGFAVLWICREPSKIFCKVCDSGLKRDLISEYIYWWRRIQNSVECCICESRRFGWFDRTTPCAPSPKALPGKIPNIGTLHGRPTVGLAFAWPSCKVCDNGINWDSLSDHIHWWRRIREDSFESHSSADLIVRRPPWSQLLQLVPSAFWESRSYPARLWYWSEMGLHSWAHSLAQEYWIRWWPLEMWKASIRLVWSYAARLGLSYVGWHTLLVPWNLLEIFMGIL